MKLFISPAIENFVSFLFMYIPSFCFPFSFTAPRLLREILLDGTEIFLSLVSLKSSCDSSDSRMNGSTLVRKARIFIMSDVSLYCKSWFTSIFMIPSFEDIPRD